MFILGDMYIDRAVSSNMTSVHDTTLHTVAIHLSCDLIWIEPEMGTMHVESLKPLCSSERVLLTDVLITILSHGWVVAGGVVVLRCEGRSRAQYVCHQVSPTIYSHLFLHRLPR